MKIDSAIFLFWLQQLISDPRQRSVPIGHSDQAQNTLLGTQGNRIKKYKDI